MEVKFIWDNFPPEEIDELGRELVKSEGKMTAFRQLVDADTQAHVKGLESKDGFRQFQTWRGRLNAVLTDTPRKTVWDQIRGR